MHLIQSNGFSTQGDVVALDTFKWMLYSQYDRCTWCSQMDAITCSDVDALYRTKWMLYKRYIGALELMA